ncbi:3226_t:CDS:2, partial [Rhizophagus irregularis]
MSKVEIVEIVEDVEVVEVVEVVEIVVEIVDIRNLQNRNIPLQTPSTTPVFNHGYDFAIPDDLLPFIPNGPLYVQSTRTKRTFIIPGSNRWFTEVRRLKRVHDAEEATKQRLIDETNQSKLLITSLKKIEQCVNLTQDLTRFQNDSGNSLEASLGCPEWVVVM